MKKIHIITIVVAILFFCSLISFSYFGNETLAGISLMLLLITGQVDCIIASKMESKKAHKIFYALIIIEILYAFYLAINFFI